MSLSFQNKIVFPAPENSYTSKSALGQVVYIPRDIMTKVNNKLDLLKHGEQDLKNQVLILDSKPKEHPKGILSNLQ